MNKIEFKNEGKQVEIKIYGEIGENYWKEEDDDNVYSLQDLDKQLKEHKDASVIDVYINSTGGSVFDGVAIFNMLKRHRAYKRVFIEGFACSVASVIAMAGNSITMPKSSMMMIHNAWCVGMGNAKEFRKLADDLDQINAAIRSAYLSKGNENLTEEKLIELMDNESYLTADECFEYGLCTKVSDEMDEESVNETLSQYTNLYENKLQTLKSIKNAIKGLSDETEILEDEVVELVDEVVEDEQEIVTEETAIETEEVIEEVVTTPDFEEVKDNALKRFFGKD